MKVFHLLLMVPVVLCTPNAGWAADDPYAAQLFAQHCASCHEAAVGGATRIPAVSQLKAMTPIAILKTLESGVMRAQAAVLSSNERQAVANILGTAVTTERRREEMANPCPAGATWKDGPGWSNWGAGLTNTRFQAAKEAGLRAEDLPRLTLKWAFAFPDSAVLREQLRGVRIVGRPSCDRCAEHRGDNEQQVKNFHRVSNSRAQLGAVTQYTCRSPRCLKSARATALS